MEAFQGHLAKHIVVITAVFCQVLEEVVRIVPIGQECRIVQRALVYFVHHFLRKGSSLRAAIIYHAGSARYRALTSSPHSMLGPGEEGVVRSRWQNKIGMRTTRLSTPTL